MYINPAVVECPVSPHILVGTPFEIIGATVNESQLECNFTDIPSSMNVEWTYNGGESSHMLKVFVCTMYTEKQ